jgi:hypothetical protein
MKLTARKTASTSEQRRAQFQTDRTRAPAVRELFPDAGLLRITLKFQDGGAHVPSPQQHTLYPAARAFFRFACPCTDCDGQFDLTSAVAGLMANTNRVRRAAGEERVAQGAMACEGVRFRDREHSRPCPMQLKFEIAATSGV